VVHEPIVEEVEQIGPNNVPVRSAGAKAGGVGFAALLARVDFLLGQTLNELHGVSGDDALVSNTRARRTSYFRTSAGRLRKQSGRYRALAGDERRSVDAYRST
jgi:hypothetical protein